MGDQGTSRSERQFAMIVKPMKIILCLFGCRSRTYTMRVYLVWTSMQLFSPIELSGT